MDTFLQIISSKIFISFLIAMILAQTIKIIHYKIKGRKFVWRMLIEDSGLPSNHSAIVSALTTAIFFELGISVLFFVCLIFSFIIFKDAFCVRMDVEKHAKLLKKLTKKEINVNIGHTPLEVLIGIILGVIVAVAVYLI